MADVSSESSSDDEVLEAACLSYLSVKEEAKKKRKRTCWARPWILRRSEHGAYHSLLQELSAEDHCALRNFLRMAEASFTYLLEKTAPVIQKQDTVMRDSIPPGEKLAVTLRFLASGDPYPSLEALYRIPRNTISKFIPEVCDAIYTCLAPDVLVVPSCHDEWLQVADGFNSKWNFPNCIGALDGKHIAIKAPPKSGSEYFNYKSFFSIILLALVDSNGRFIFIDIGANGRAGDAGIYANSKLCKALQENTLNLPEPRPVGKQSVPFIPFTIVGDDAFPLKPYLMKPYPQRHLSNVERIFNYRLSRARRISENAFGILTSRFGIFQRKIQLLPENAVKICKAAVVLHNFLTKDARYIQSAIEDTDSNTQFPSMMQPLCQQGGNRSAMDAREVRDHLANFFVHEGQVPWQWSIP